MKTAIFLIVATLGISVVFSTLINLLSTTSVIKANMILKKAAASVVVLKECSMHNAAYVNRESSSSNKPVREDGYEFLDSIVEELTNERNDADLAKTIVNLRKVI